MLLIIIKSLLSKIANIGLLGDYHGEQCGWLIGGTKMCRSPRSPRRSAG